MPSPATQLALADIKDQTIQQCLAPLLATHSLPCSLQRHDETLSCGHDYDQDVTSLELVLFADTPLSRLMSLLAKAGLQLQAVNAINQRAQRTSYRFSVTCQDRDAARHAIADFAGSENMEAALVANAPELTQPGLLVMDMDSTTIAIECIDEIAKLAGVGAEVAEVTERAMQGELDFAQSLVQRVAKLKDADEAILAHVADNMPLMNGLQPLLAELKRHGWKIAIASGGFSYFAERLKSSLALDDAIANELEIVTGRLTGKVLGAIVDAKVKASSVQHLAQKYHIAPEQTIAMGDGANDLLMMANAHLGVAFHAKPVVLAQADCSINHAGLDTLLHWLR